MRQRAGARPLWLWPLVGGLLVLVAARVAGDRSGLEQLGVEYEREIRPLLARYCLGCHSTRRQRGELDLECFTDFTHVRREPRIWQQVLEMLDLGEMPPEDRKQPSKGELERLHRWVGRYLDAEARASAGDPGPVVLRRLSNSEYTYTIHDLTTVAFNPAEEFPSDGAAGEGFTNTGNALGMSPALLEKYLDAGKDLAAHAVLLPDGFRFSLHSSPRDWTDEILARIRGLYEEVAPSVSLGVGDEVGNLNVHGNTNLGRAGRLPLERYFAATLAERDALESGARILAVVARDAGLNERYLARLWSSLTAVSPSPLLEPLRARWRQAQPQDAALLAAEVAAWQKGLWIFGPVGLIGRKGGPSRWMLPAETLVSTWQHRLSIPVEHASEEATFSFSLVVTDAGDGNDQDFMIWERPRLVTEGRPEILLRDVQQLMGENWGLPAAWFGKHPGGVVMDSASLYVRAPSSLEVRLPLALAAGYEFVTTASFGADSGALASVQPALLVGAPEATSGLLPSRVTVDFSQVTQVFSESGPHLPQRAPGSPLRRSRGDRRGVATSGRHAPVLQRRRSHARRRAGQALGSLAE